MSGNYGQTTQNCKEIDQLILSLQRQKLNTQKRNANDEHPKRLCNVNSIVGGRKLDKDKCQPRTKRFGQATGCEEGPQKKELDLVPALEKCSEKVNSNDCQEQLKNFSFNFSQTNKSNEALKVAMNLDKQENVAKADHQKSKKLIEPQKPKKNQSDQKINRKYELDRMYFVLDTNVLIDSLHLMEDVANSRLFGTVGSILYVPYMVIKELDTLKCMELKSFAARRAIEYLNVKFDNLDKIEAQSALDDAEQLIVIDSADDRIVNCCLQLKQQLTHMMLLTNDNNLRLKAHASSISVSTCYQLSSYKSNWWTLPRDRREDHRHRRFRARI